MKSVLKILIVDDDKAICQVLSEIVKKAGFKPVVCNKPADALNVVRLQAVHGAILDVMLPKTSGVDLADQFRETKFGDNPIIFISGIFKDKAFASDSMKKTGAMGFLFKPFEAKDMIALLETAMKDQVSAEKWTVQSLLTAELKSKRERAKAIEGLEQIKGLDFPFILSVLMEAEISGHLNIVGDSGEIFGINLIKGTISNVDSTEAQGTSVLALINDGFLSQEDWDEFQKRGSMKSALEKLVQEGLISPHAIAHAKHQQILHDFRAICGAEILQVNFVPDEEDDQPPKHAVSLHQLLLILATSLDEFFPTEYLIELYKPVLNSRAILSGPPEIVQMAFQELSKHGLGSLKKMIDGGHTPRQIFESAEKLTDGYRRGLHYLVLHRIVRFENPLANMNLKVVKERYQKMLGDLTVRTPDKIFEFFGVPSDRLGNVSVIEKIYADYKSANGPDSLNTDAPKDLRDLVERCFQIVTEARDTMVDEEKRKALYEELKNEADEKQKWAATMVQEGLDLLRKGQAKAALDRLKQAEITSKSTRQAIISIWAEIKVGGVVKARYQDMLRQLEAIAADDRRSPHYHMALGLVRRGLGDPTAVAAFEKAIQIDSTFLDARREINAGQKAAKAKADKTDILNGDITNVISQLFKRKAD